MPKLRKILPGKFLEIKGIPIKFSSWSVKRPPRGHHTPQSQIFTNDPWNIIIDTLSSITDPNERANASNFIEQAKDYYFSAISSKISAAKPLLTYYFFLNLAKALISKRRPGTNLTSARHGVIEHHDNSTEPNFLRHKLPVHPTGTYTNIFPELASCLGHSLPHRMDIKISDLLPQIIIGHRLWCAASNSAERFFPITSIRYVHSRTINQVWLRLYCSNEDIQRTSHRNLICASNMLSHFREVKSKSVIDGKRAICFEQITPLACTSWPANRIPDLNTILKNKIWTVLLNTKPYRKYYLYLAPTGETVLPQLLSIYALSVYFGSITRYRPKQFHDILNSAFGSQIKEFIENQTMQALYFFASEFAERDIVKPAIV
jgi:hypothetical protein